MVEWNHFTLNTGIKLAAHRGIWPIIIKKYTTESLILYYKDGYDKTCEYSVQSCSQGKDNFNIQIIPTSIIHF